MKRLFRHALFWIGTLWTLAMLWTAILAAQTTGRAILSTNGVTLIFSNVPEAFYLEGSTDMVNWQDVVLCARSNSILHWNRVEFEVEPVGLSFYRIREAP